MSESDPIDLSNLQNLQFRPSWAEDLAKSDAGAGEVVWGRAPGGPSRDRDRDERPRHGGGPRREGSRPFDRNDRGARPERRGPGPDFRQKGPPRPGDRRPPPRGDTQGPPRGERREGVWDQRAPGPERRDFQSGRRDGRGTQGRPPFRGDRRDSRDYRGQPDHREMPPPLPGWHVTLIPDHRSVEAIARQIKASGRAFSVFDVGRLFMESRDRYQVRFSRRQESPVRNKEGAPADASSPQGPEELVQCKADGSLWLTRDEAIRHLLQSPALTKYYRAETVAIDAPKGNWNSVAVCGFSGTLLGPPNHHDFQRNVARLHRERFSDMPLERYKSRIRTEKDEALLQKWQESLSSATHYVPLTGEPASDGAEPPAALKSVAEMEAHFLKNHAPDAAVAITKATVPGNIPGKYLSAPLLGMLRTEVERQQRFPMQLVQDLCRDLESQGLRFFKRDKKTTFVCRNRPHFLPDDLVLSDRIRVMVEMVRANPGITYSRLVSTLAPDIVLASAPGQAAADPASAGPEAKAGAEATPTEQAASSVAEEPPAETAPVDAESIPETAAEALDGAAEAPVAAGPVPPATSAAPDESSGESTVFTPTADDAAEKAPESGEPVGAAGHPALSEELPPSSDAGAPPSSDAGAPPSSDAGAPPAPESAPAAPSPPPHLSPEEIIILQDLHWLVQEGYVTEFQNGELWVLGRPPQPPAEKRPRPARPAEPAAKAAEVPVTETGSEAVPDETPVVVATIAEEPAVNSPGLETPELADGEVSAA